MNIGLLDTQADKLVDMIQPVNLLHPLARDMQAWWKALPGTTGGSRLMDIRNPGPNGKHGTLTTMDPVTDWISDEGRSALFFDGTNGTEVVLNPFILDTTKPWSVSWWNKINSGHGSFVGEWSLATDQATGFVCSHSSSANYVPVFFGSHANFVNLKVVDNWISEIPDEWQCYSLVYDGTGRTTNSNYKFYRNGGLEGVENNGGMSNVINNSRIGYAHISTTTWDGSFGDFIIHGRALSAWEVNDLCDLGQQNYPGLLNHIESPVVSAVAAGGIVVTPYFYEHLMAGVA